MSITLLQKPRQFLASASFIVLWCLLLKHLSLHWSTNPQYSFGWLVPLVCCFIFYARWISRPQPAPSQSGGGWIFCVACVAFMPIWFVEQPNPDWRLVSWALALDVVALSLCAVYFMGGRPWLGHFAFSICFILTAVPWPFGLEAFVIEHLMQTAAAITVEVLNLFDIPALQHGNVIEVRTGMLGIDEACSGIRSLQATIMAALFLGELYRTTWQRRLVLLCSGVAIAFLCNVGRAFLLAFVAARDGMGAIAKWHDPAGFTILAICFCFLFGLARVMSGPLRAIQHSNAGRPGQFPSRLAALLAVWLLFTLAGSEAWYRSHEVPDATHWSINWPVGADHFSDITIPEAAVDLLKFNEGKAASWKEGDGSEWTVFFFKWSAGSSRSRMLARSHRPEICLPSIGYKLQADRGMVAVQAKGLSIPFHASEFGSAGSRADVFFCIWQGGSRQELPGNRNDWSRWAGLQSVLMGERNLSQQTLEIVVTGYATPEEAETALRRRAGSLVQVDQSPP